MLRIIKLLSCTVALLALWIAGLRSNLSPSTHQTILWAPFAAVVAFGLYSIAAVLHGVFTFQDCPEEAASLRKDIELARADLIRKGVLQA